MLSRITAGQSLALPPLPGTGGTQTAINAIGSLVRAGKRVLVVSARRSTLDGIRHRLGAIGLDGLGVMPPTLRKDLIRAIGRNEKATQPKVAEIDEALVRLRPILADYRAALAAPHPDFGVSVMDATRALAKLAQRADPPTTAARLDARALASVAADRSAAAAQLTLAARLGEFRFGPDDSPWYGVSFSTTESAGHAHDLAGRLHKQDVSTLLERGYELIAHTRMRPFLTVDELGEYLRLLAGIRETLDKFSPAVFERPLDELIAAHGPRRESADMNNATRRRLKNLSREYVRPGVHVADMYEALVRIRTQRTLWQRYVEQGAVPEVPVGLHDVAVKWQRVHADLGELDGVLGRTGNARLAAMPVAQLVRTLAGLAAESKYFDNLVERAKLRTQLAKLGLEPLLEEMSVRHVDEARVADELEFTWWQSVLEHLLQHDRRLLGANTSIVDSLERDFRLVDEAHNANSGPLLAAKLATDWRIGLVDHPDEAAALKRALTRGAPTPGDLRTVAPHLTDILAPVWLASPYEVPQLGEEYRFDVAIIADAGAINLAEAAPTIRRARQLVVIGDPATQAPTPFTIASASSGDWEAEESFDTTSIFERVAEIVPVETLTRSYRAGGEDLAELVNDAFYGGEIVSLPWAGSFLGRGSLSVDYVDGGYGVPDPDSGAVESPDAEVNRVVTLVVEHAVKRPRESLMVVTASRRHAERVRSAVAAAFAGRSDVADFVSRDAGEPFAVLTLEESVAESRDRVIFSLGFGVTRHGRVLSDFGDLSTPDGERLLTVGMTRARRSMVIVSCIRPSDVEDGRLEHGAATVMGILAGVDERAQITYPTDGVDPLLRSLAHELTRFGITVELNYRGTLPLVARHGGKAVVVESDTDVAGESLRESVRLRPQTLRRLGWHYVRVHAFDLYSDPNGVATRIAVLLGHTPATPAASDETAPVPTV
uniref:AAA family ATPase n=1 Tax=Microbacterium gorillae TaxID=1231063 RepID=UPI000ABB82D6